MTTTHPGSPARTAAGAASAPVAPVAGASPPSRGRGTRRRWGALPWLLPSAALLLGVVAYPVAVSVQSALTRYTSFGYTQGFAGLRNFTTLFSEPDLPHVALNTLRWVLCVVAGTLLVSMVLAQLLDARFRGRRVLRWALIVPWAASLVITSVVWRYVYERDYGYLNRVLLDLHLIDQPVSWTVSPSWTPWALILVGIAVSVPFTTFVLLAGLQSLDADVYEAAGLDGAGPVQTYLRITLPLLRPALTITLVLNTIYVFNSFPIIWVLTGSQPGYANDTLITYMYKIAFKSNLDIGEAAALSVVNVAITLLLALAMMRLTSRQAGGAAPQTPDAPAAAVPSVSSEAGASAGSSSPAVLDWPSTSRTALSVVQSSTPGVTTRASRPLWDVRVPRSWPKVRRWLLPLIAALVAVVSVSPYIVMFLSSLKSDRDLFASPAQYLPSRWLWHNWIQTFSTGALPEYFRNSIIVAVAGTALVLVVAVPSAYYTARHAHRGRSLFLNVVLITQMFAPVALVVGIAREWQQLGLTDSLTAVTLTDAGFNLAFAIWMLRSTFASIPEDIEEAARIDGLGDVRILLRVCLPLARPGLVTATIFTFISIWNEFVAALTITSTPRSQPLTVGITTFIGQYQVHYQYLFVASLVAVIPVVALFIAIERHLVGGLTAGAVK